MASPDNRVQVVDGDGTFQYDGLQKFSAESGLPESRTNYQVVAIMGPQSSGKSTLMNHVFGTSFTMMDAMAGRGQTTKGIWMARSPKISETLTLVMDLEGSDGRERGEDDTNFERQSALFALAVADVLLVNIWCHDIGREQGSGKPLLKTIFQVNLKLFAPEPNRKKTVLLFVLRDKTKTPLPKLVEVLEADLIKMWDSISKPQQYQDSKMQDFFELQYAGLSHFEEKYEDFMADTVMLRRRFTPDADDTLVRPQDHLPGDSFVLSIRNIWDVVRSQKDLNLPAHKVMVANIRCSEIRDDQLRAFSEDQAWQALKEEATSGGGGAAGSVLSGEGDAALPVAVVHGFNERLMGLMDSCIKGYESDALYFDAHVREEKQQELTAKLHEVVAPVVEAQTTALHEQHLAAAKKELQVAMMGSSSAPKPAFAEAAAAVRAGAVSAHKKAFDRDIKMAGTQWDGKAAVEQFEAALDAHIAAVRASKISEAVARAEKALNAATSGPVISLLDACPTNLWQRLHAVTRDAAAAAGKSLMKVLDGYALEREEAQKLLDQLTSSAQDRLENHVREAALTRASRMKDKFTEVFTLDEQKTPRMWSTRDNIPAVANKARMAAAHLLAQLAVIRQHPAAGGAAGGVQLGSAGDAVEAAVLRLAEQDLNKAAGLEASVSGDHLRSTSTSRRDGIELLDILSASTWPGVPEECVLLQPHEVRATWREFMSSSNVMVQQALATQQANRLAGSRAPPLWAMAAMLFLGWNELMAVLWNPLLLILLVAAFLFLRTLYVELDVEGEMAKGALPGALSLAGKLTPALQKVLGRTMDAVQAFAAKAGEEVRAVERAAEEDNSVEMHYRRNGSSSSSSAQAPGVSAAGLSNRRAPSSGEAAGSRAEGAGAAPAAGERRKDL